MQRASKNPEIEFRPRISIHYDACPALWEVFNNIPMERRATAIMVMLTRLVTLEQGGQTDAAPVRARKTATAVATTEPIPVVAPSPAPVPTIAAGEENQSTDDDISRLVSQFGEGGLDEYLGTAR